MRLKMSSLHIVNVISGSQLLTDNIVSIFSQRVAINGIVGNRSDKKGISAENV